MPEEPSINEIEKLIKNPYATGADGGMPDDKIVANPQISYWEQSRQPLASLFFILPFLVIYEVGVLLQPPGTPRNGAEVWLRQLLSFISFGTLQQYYFLLPILIVVILLSWHHMTTHRWQISRGLLIGMFIESLVLAYALIMIAHFQGRWLSFSTIELSIGESLSKLVSFFGAGVYEEMLFRLIMLPAVAWLLKGFGLKNQSPWLIAAVITSLLFSAAHHIGPMGEPLTLRPFVFRSIAGMFFCLLFLYRGFGISVGTHALYDIMVGLL